MKPCADKKEAIALLVTNALAFSETTTLRDHLQQCPACDAYAKQLASISEVLGEPMVNSTAIQPPPGFHARLKQRIQSEPEAPSFSAVLQTLRNFLTPARLVSTAVAVVLVFAFVFWLPTDKQPSTPLVSQGSAVTPPLAASEPYSTSTLMAYQAAFNRSLEDLDALVTQNSRRSSMAEGMTLMGAGSAGL